jgi:hypothetical protein
MAWKGGPRWACSRTSYAFPSLLRLGLSYSDANPLLKGQRTDAMLITVRRPALVIALMVFALANSSASGAQQLTEAFCKDPATQRAVEADARRQRLLNPPLEIASVRFEYLDATRLGSFCIFRVAANTGSTFEFALRVEGARGGVPRFQFRHLD